MKKILQYLILTIVIGFSGWAIYYYSLNPCEKPLEYSLGRFDSQFGISQENFKSYITSAGSIWEKALDRKILIYNPDASFKINLIYDQRQLETAQKQKTEFGLSAVESAFKNLDAKFNDFKTKYEQRVAEHERALSDFDLRKKDYDRQVAFWNSKKGAPSAEYEALETEREYLNTEASRLNAEASEINSMARELNQLLSERNAKATEYNKIAEAYNRKYSGGLEFNQAEYIGNPDFNSRSEINIYQFGNREDLVLALAHEFGHALGMDHVENPKSIMYYLTSTHIEGSILPSNEDLAELKRVCK